MGRESAIGILRKAVKKSSVFIDFELQIGDDILKLTMKNPDIMEMSKVQELAKASEYARASAKGLDRVAIDEKKWETFCKEATSGIKDKNQKARALKNLNNEKPANRAEQIAKEAAYLVTAKEILPTVIYSDDELVFKDAQDIELFNAIISSPENFTLLIGKFTELVTKVQDVGAAAKNLKAPSPLN